MYRIFINSSDMDEAVKLLEDNYIKFDYDSGDRLMIHERQIDEALDLFDENFIDYEVM